MGYRDIENIRDDYESVCRASVKPAFNCPKVGDVIDEEKSVRWNREEVERRIADYKKAERELIECKNNAFERLDTEVCDYIAGETHISTEKSIKVWNWIYANYHDNVYRMFGMLEDIVDLIYDVIN